MYYLVISAAFFAVLFLVLYFKERRAKESGQRELRIVNSKLEDENLKMKIACTKKRIENYPVLRED